jgi:nitrogen fixation protein NifU and related proteins
MEQQADTADRPRPVGEQSADVDANAMPLAPVRRSLFSAAVMQHGRHPSNLGLLDRPDAIATLTGWCGEVMAISVRLDGEQITEATFMADGCLSTMACGDMLTTIARGLSLEAAARITPQELIAALDGLPQQNTHCAELAVNTLREAIDTHSRHEGTARQEGAVDHARS